MLRNGSRKSTISLAAGLLVAGVVTACIEVSGPGGNTNNGIPYVRQETPYYCIPASIQMSAKFSGISNPVSQQQLFLNMGGEPDGFGPGGVTIGTIAPEMSRNGGVWDAVMDHMFFDNIDFLARQISAATQPSPVIALVNHGYHAGVLNGGQWHKQTTPAGMTQYVWDQVKFHDPNVGPDQLYTAASWANLNCGEGNPVCYQALSNSAAQAGPNAASEYDVVYYGGGGIVDREVLHQY